jgi:hypothetical protein
MLHTWCSFDRYLTYMTKTPEQMRRQAQEYRELHAHLTGPVLNDAIEQVALALDRSADALEAELAEAP